MRFLLLFIFFIHTCICAVASDEGRSDSASVLKKKGDVFYYTGRFPEALDYYTRGLDKAESEKNVHIYNACIGCIGNVYASIGDYNRCLHYYKQGYETSVKIGDADMQYNFASNMLACYCLKKDIEKAKAIFKIMMQLPVKDQQNRQYYYLYNQGYIAQASEDFPMAEYYHKQALDFAVERDMAPMYLQAQYAELGTVALKSGKVEKAIGFFEQCREITEKMGNGDKIVKVYRQLSEAYSCVGKKDSADKYKYLYLELSDSVFNKSQFYVASNELFKYENAVNQKTISSLTTRNTTQMVVIIVFVVMLVILMMLYVLLRNKNKKLVDAQILLVSKNEELMKSDRQSKLLLEKYVKAINADGHIQENQEQTDLEKNRDVSDCQDEDAEAKRERPNSAPISEEQKNMLLNRINTVMADINVISCSDFNLSRLSHMVESNTKYVSWVINDVYGKNFRQFLSEYRIREACRRMSDKENYGNVTLQAIYEELGYNSAASFIQAFKKVNGMTPSTYQRLIDSKPLYEDAM